jgi:hypothetical protein
MIVTIARRELLAALGGAPVKCIDTLIIILDRPEDALIQTACAAV